MTTQVPGSAETRPSDRHRVQSLQILRFVAAFLVFVGHAQHELGELTGPAAGRWAFVPLDWGLGVDIFFVISGFVMYFLTADGFGVAGGPADFMRRRIIRIVPLYWLFSLLMLAALVHAANGGGATVPGPANILFSFLFLPGPQCDGYCFPIFSLGWTLNYEMLFYAIFAVALFFSRRAGMAIIVGAILTLMALRQILPETWVMLRFWGYPITGEFLAGIGIAALFRSRARIGTGAALALVALGVATAMIFYQYGVYHSVSRVVTGGVPAALIVAGTVLGLEPARALGWLGHAFVVGGDASYALYLWHPFGIKIATAIATRLPLAFSPTVFLLVSAGIVVAGAVVIHRYVERPVTSLLNRMARRRHAPVTSDARSDGKMPLA